MGVYAAALVVCFQAARGVRLAAFWDGGPVCDVHAIGHGFGPCVERWSMTNPATGKAGIPYTVEALRELVAFRLADAAAVGEMVGRFSEVARLHTKPPEVSRVPAFSAN